MHKESYALRCSGIAGLCQCHIARVYARTSQREETPDTLNQSPETTKPSRLCKPLDRARRKQLSATGLSYTTGAQCPIPRDVEESEHNCQPGTALFGILAAALNQPLDPS